MGDTVCVTETGLATHTVLSEARGTHTHTHTHPYSLVGGAWHRMPDTDSLTQQVSFAKEPYKRDDNLQKRPVILRAYYNRHMTRYVVALVSRIDKIIGLFCKRAL